MKMFVLNEDAGLDGVLPDGAEWCVQWYETGSYEGHGTAYAGNSKGEYWTTGLGHCSCYGPCDDVSQWDKITLSDLKMHLIGETQGFVEKIREEGLADI